MIKKGSEERGRKKGGDTDTKGAEFDTIMCWRETKNPNPQARLFNLHPVTASRFVFNAQHDRRGLEIWAEKESAGKVGTHRVMCVGCSQRMKEESSNKREPIGEGVRDCATRVHKYCCKI